MSRPAVLSLPERKLPSNDEAERAVLGAILLHDDVFCDVSDIIQPPDFYRESNRKIFGKMTALHERGDAIDLVTLREELAADLDDIGGAAYIAALVDGVPHSSNVGHYARIIKEKATLRALIFAANKMAADAYACEESPDVVIQSVKQTLEILSATVHSPAPDEGPQWPAPPTSAAFLGFAGELVDTIEPHTEADRVALLANILTWFGNGVGRAPCFELGTKRHGGNINVALVGRSGLARKGESEAAIRYYFERADPDWVDFCVGGGLASGEGMLADMRDPIATPGTPAAPVDKRRLYTEHEFSTVLRKMRRESSVLSGTLRDLWDSPERIANKTKADPMVITGCHASVIAHITMEELQQELGDVERFNGFANRFLWIAVRRSRELPEPAPPRADMIQPYIDELSQRLCAARTVGAMRRTTAGSERYRQWFSEWTEDRLLACGPVGAFFSRCHPYVIRLSLIYALLQGARHIDAEHIDAAIALWDYQVRSVQYIFGGRTGNDLADRILGKLREAMVEGMTKTEVHRACGNNRDKHKVDQALALLAALGLAHCIKNKTGGAPVERWFAGGRRLQVA